MRNRLTQGMDLGTNRSTLGLFVRADSGIYRGTDNLGFSFTSRFDPDYYFPFCGLGPVLGLFRI